MSDSLWSCDTDGCQKPGVRVLGDCIVCDRHLCSKHLQPEFHKCPPWEDSVAYVPLEEIARKEQLIKLRSKINIPALALHAFTLRKKAVRAIGPLDIDHNEPNSMTRARHYHIPIHFADGVIWLARIQEQHANAPPPAVRDLILQNQYATLRFLEELDVHAPGVFGYGLEQDTENRVGVGYLLLEKLPGTVFNWSSATPRQRKKVMDQVADVYIELSKYPFDKLGVVDPRSVALLDRPNNSRPLVVGGIFSGPLTTDIRSRTKEVRPLGPFNSLDEYYEHYITRIHGLISADQCYAHYAVDAFLAHLFFEEIRSLVVGANSKGGDAAAGSIPAAAASSSSSQPDKNTTQVDPQKFYLKHWDDRGDHILVDEHFNITGIIDWENAQITSAAYAFSSPLVFLHVDELFNGINDPGKHELDFAHILEKKGNKDLADFVRNGRTLIQFRLLVGYDFRRDFEGFLGLFEGLRKAINVDAHLDWDDWKSAALIRYQDKPRFKGLLSKIPPQKTSTAGASARPSKRARKE
ncbi:hypothetical protein L228DRAFT_283737 [Xylona heveae TC161]|uniref:Uncharacterized protein n=1 Tax=Xylona heveae (strain CBS 132557 / TC161) TaxID=1328760 RepID=A0A165G0B1_XYLHT|nr:hypothetical protein L228DRAFT_283737 [Xylona heveae TC161]KZF21590.1 hypothetical protein L228DRAFT_283737 [Xylona heveae TC161]